MVTTRPSRRSSKATRTWSSGWKQRSIVLAPSRGTSAPDGGRVSEDYMNERVQNVLSAECLEKLELDFSLTDQEEDFKGDEPRRRN